MRRAFQPFGRALVMRTSSVRVRSELQRQYESRRLSFPRQPTLVVVQRLRASVR
jgi:hypothetical protein